MKTAPRLLSILLMLLPFAAGSQSLSLNVADAEAGKVYLQNLDVDVKVTGNIASTTWTMIFRNETSRQLEGELNFPLADGITVSRYAIDINGRLREAVPVDKAKGTTVLEAIENRRVDPGLLERVEGNAFRTRIYPLPPNGTRTVVIGYEETLHGRTVGQLDYTLPLSFARAVPKIEIRVSSFAGSKAATGAGFDQQGTSWSATKTLTDYKSGQPLQFRIPQSGTETALMEASGNHYYTLINTPSRTGSRERVLPTDISIVWDASLSRLNRNAKAELDLLDAYLRKVRNARISLIVFSNTIQPSRAFSVANGNWAQLRNAIEGIIYDGGTGLGALDFGKLPGKEILLFSDGLNTYGAGSLKKAAVPVFAISSNTHSDFGALRGTAHSSGGALIDLSSRPLAEAITALTKQELQLLRIRADRDIEEVYPDAPVAAAGGVAITAISYKANGSVVLQYGYGKEVTQEVRVALDADAQKAPGANLGRIWAMNKIAALDGAYEQNRPVIEQLGRRFRLVTRNTSLIVLENLSDYLQYGIEPPEELREAYRQQLKARGTQVAAAVKNRLEKAEETFEELIGWWRGKPARPKTPEPIINGSIQGQIKDRRGRSMSNVNVQVYKGEQLQGSTLTGADGHFYLSSLPPGNYRVKVVYLNKDRLSERLRIVANGSRQLNRTIRLSAGEQVSQSRQYNTRRYNTRSSKLGNATITGTLKDERGNPVVNAYVEVISGRVILGRELTDFDGNYTIRPLPGGKYNVQFKFQGKELLITDVSLAIDQTRIVNGTLNSGRNRNEVTVQSRRYVAPLIDLKEPGGRSVKTAEQIEKAATRNSLDIAALSTQTYQQGRGAGISIGGGRTSGTKVIIDGVQQNPGAVAFMNPNVRPAAGYQFNSGVAARYGDASGGIVNENASTTEAGSNRPAAGIPIPSYAFDPELLGVLRSLPPEAQYAKYLQLRDSSMHVPAFYFQASAHFIATGRKGLGLRILSNLAELDLENYEMMKALGYKLRELGETDAAAAAFHKVVRWRPMEPQSLRDYGLALADQGRYGAALDTLYAALTGRIDAELADDYAGIEEVLLCDINALLRAHGTASMRGRIPRQIVRPLSADIRVVVNWNMKDTDIDLWITDPDGERCDYSNSETAAGGRISDDMTDGFGPEQFLLRKAIPGTYTVEIDYFGSDAVKISGPTVVSAEIYTHWGTAKEHRQMITMQMKPTDKGGVLVGEFQFGKDLSARGAARKQRN